MLETTSNDLPIERKHLIDFMHSFLQNAGGKIRFDTFAEEHLLGRPHGFYRSGIDLTKDHLPVPTPMSGTTRYREAYAVLVLLEADRLAQRTGQTSIRICEVGPGGGELNDALCGIFSGPHVPFHALKSIEYVAVDPNIAHVRALQSRGFSARYGSLQSMPLESNSVDILVGEEVLDSLPYRILAWCRRSKRFCSEFFVELKDGSLAISPENEPTGEEIAELSHHLIEMRFKGAMYPYSPAYLPIWQEVARVIHQNGVVMLSDYSTNSPHFRLADLEFEQSALANPYQVDLTHFIDFTLQQIIAQRAGFKSIYVTDNSLEFAGYGCNQAFAEVKASERRIIRASLAEGVDFQNPSSRISFPPRR